MPSSSLVQRSIVLGLLIAIIAFAVDLYMPTFVFIANDLKTDPGRVQLSMTSFLAGMGVAQVIYGPVSDAVGRKTPIYFGLAVFFIGSVAAAFAPSVDWLIAARLLEGIGAGAAAVIPLAVIRDEYTGAEAARVYALCMLSLSVSPILAPVAGGLLAQVVSWRVIFGVLIVMSGLAALMIAKLLPETHPPHRRVSAHPWHVSATYWRLLGNPHFMAPLAVASFAQSILLVFISGSSFVYVGLHHLTATQFGIVFACHAIVLIGISQFNGFLMRTLGVTRLLLIASTVATVAGVTLAVLVINGMSDIVPFVALSVVIFACVGLSMAPGFMTAMEPFGDNAGAAAALGSGLEMAFSALMTALLGLSADGTARPLAVFMAIGGCGALICWVWMAQVLRRAPAVEVAA